MIVENHFGQFIHLAWEQSGATIVKVRTLHVIFSLHLKLYVMTINLHHDGTITSDSGTCEWIN